MNCFPCFSSHKSKKSIDDNDLPVAQATAPSPSPPTPAPAPAPAPQPAPAAVVDASPPRTVNNSIHEEEANTAEDKSSRAKTFTFRELAAATKNFKQECLLGEGGFGRVYKGTLQPTGKVVAVKQLDRNGMQGNKEFLVEVLVLSLLHHPNLVHLVGYCADGDQRLLVYEYMPIGSLEDHLLDISGDKKPLDWSARMKIASGAAQGIEYLHEKANPPVIYRDLKSSNIFLDEDFNPRLSDYGLAKLGLGGSKMHVSYGYCAPEYERSGELTLKSDVYSFGVILLELISGRRAIDTTRPMDEQNLVCWALPIFRDPKRFPELADPLLNGKFPVRSLNQVVGVAAMCLQEESSVRPLISDVVAALSFLTTGQDDVDVPCPLPNSSKPQKLHNHGEGDSSDSSESSDDEENLEKPQEQVKKTVKWANNSRCRSKVESRDGSTGSSSSNHNSDVEAHRSNSRQNSNRDGSAGSSSSDNSDSESEHGILGQNSRSNSNVGWQGESDAVESHEGSALSNSRSEDGSVGSHSAALNSNVGS